MNIIDKRLSKSETDILKNLIGKKMNAVNHDQFTFTNSSKKALAKQVLFWVGGSEI